MSDSSAQLRARFRQVWGCALMLTFLGCAEEERPSADAAMSASPEEEDDEPDSSGPDEGAPFDGAVEDHEAGAEDTGVTRDAGALDATADRQVAATTRDATWLDGFWEGETSQAKAIKIEVVSGGLARIELGWSVPQCASTTVATFAMSVPIVQNRVERKVAGGPGGITYTLTATLGDDDQGSGTVQFMLIPIPGQPSCTGSANVTFTAKRTGPPRRDP